MRSMTGYGKCQMQRDAWEVTVELRAVNHRYLDVAMRLPRNLLFLEDGVRKGLQALIRGHVDVADPEQTGIYLGPHRHIVKLDSETNGASLYTLDGELLFKPEYLEGELENWQDFSYRFIDGTDPKGLIHIRFGMIMMMLLLPVSMI